MLLLRPKQVREASSHPWWQARVTATVDQLPGSSADQHDGPHRGNAHGAPHPRATATPTSGRHGARLTGVPAGARDRGGKHAGHAYLPKLQRRMRTLVRFTPEVTERRAVRGSFRCEAPIGTRQALRRVGLLLVNQRAERDAASLRELGQQPSTYGATATAELRGL